MDADRLIERATADSNLPPRGESYRTGLEVFVEDYNKSTTVTDFGRTVAEQMVADTLIARYGIEDWIVRHPEVLDAPVVRPVFILGLPRAGTTLLLNLLALDAQHRTYGNWEANREVPPVEAAHRHDDPRITRKIAEVNAALESGALDPRKHMEMGDEPGECVWLLAQDFKSYAWLIPTAVPNYLDWLYTKADMVSAYRHHKRALQVMQSRAPGNWILKFPSHAPFLDALLSIYPDARIVLTHRDPIRPLASSCSASHHYSALLNSGLDPNHVGWETMRVVTASLQGVSTLRARHPHVPVYDMHYLRFAADPLAEIGRLYRFFEERLTPEVERAMRTNLAAHNAKRADVGPHRYSLATYGISSDKLPRIFRDYVQQFGIVEETE
jgi:hypothetical protein